MRIVADRDVCGGHAMCESLVPDIFTVGRDGVVQIAIDSVPDDRLDDVELAVDSCPVAALRLEQ